MDYEIVPMTEEYTASYHAVLSHVIREGKYLAFWEPPSFESAKEFVRQTVAKNHASFLALVSGKVVGWCDISPVTGMPRSAHIGSLGIGLLPEYRGKGLGKSLIKAAVDKARADGILRIEFTVREGNKKAVEFYKKSGFEIEGLKKKAHKNADGSFDSLYLMARVF